MRQGVESIVHAHRIQRDVSDMLAKRGVCDEDVQWESSEFKSCLWSFQRGDWVVVCVASVNKDQAEAIVAAASCPPHRRLVVIHAMKCTHVASKVFGEHAWIEVWSAQDLSMNPLKFSFLRDAGLMLRPHPPEFDKYPRIHVADPLARYLGARVGDGVWSSTVWFTLGQAITHRIVTE